MPLLVRAELVAGPRDCARHAEAVGGRIRRMVASRDHSAGRWPLRRGRANRQLSGVAVVTGGARGIGRGIAEAAVARGLTVVLSDLEGDLAAATAREIGAVAGIAQDVREESSHAELARAAAAYGPIVAWFNNAGVGHDGSLMALSSTEIQTMVEVNLMGVIWGTRAALESFGPAGGDIVITGSLSSHGPVPGLSVYAATKAAVVSLATSVNLETPPQVRVHALCPDGVDTRMVADMSATGEAKALIFAGGSLYSPAEVGAAAVALLGSRRVVR
ncbi:MAG: SDR family oxidoreductase, partial [Nocardioides sp.]